MPTPKLIQVVSAACLSLSVLLTTEVYASEPELSLKAFVDLNGRQQTRGRRWGLVVLLRFPFTTSFESVGPAPPGEQRPIDPREVSPKSEAGL